MFEEYIEPAKVYFGNNSIPGNNKNDVITIYGDRIFNDFNKLKNDFFKSNAFLKYESPSKENFNIVQKKAESDFKLIHPDCCKELINLFWWSYSYQVWKNGCCYPDK